MDLSSKNLFWPRKVPMYFTMYSICDSLTYLRDSMIPDEKLKIKNVYFTCLLTNLKYFIPRCFFFRKKILGEWTRNVIEWSLIITTSYFVERDSSQTSYSIKRNCKTILIKNRPLSPDKIAILQRHMAVCWYNP